MCFFFYQYRLTNPFTASTCKISGLKDARTWLLFPFHSTQTSERVAAGCVQSSICWLLQNVGGDGMCTVPFAGCCNVWVGVGGVQSHFLAAVKCGWEWDVYSSICWLLWSVGGSGMCTEFHLLAAVKCGWEWDVYSSTCWLLWNVGGSGMGTVPFAGFSEAAWITGCGEGDR